MDEDLWFKEEIGPAEETLETLDKTIKGLAPEALAAAVGEPALNDLTKGQQAQYARAFAVGLRGSVLAARPLARPVSPVTRLCPARPSPAATYTWQDRGDSDRGPDGRGGHAGPGQ